MKPTSLPSQYSKLFDWKTYLDVAVSLKMPYYNIKYSLALVYVKYELME